MPFTGARLQRASNLQGVCNAIIKTVIFCKSLLVKIKKKLNALSQI